jgi:hypothetical protein
MKKILFAFVLAACATIPKADQVKIRAAHDFQCDADSVQTTQIDDKTIRVAACGKEATYTEECVSSDTTRCTWIAQRAGGTTVGNGSTTGAQ